jgi:hypothetical protein
LSLGDTTLKQGLFACPFLAREERAASKLQLAIKVLCEIGENNPKLKAHEDEVQIKGPKKGHQIQGACYHVIPFPVFGGVSFTMPVNHGSVE